jgi:ParB/Sulfiredoxin domain
VKKVSAGHAGRQHAISEIRIGNRYRRDLGDVSGLADSIAELGLLHPIVIRADGRLVVGERRLAACKSWAGNRCLSLSSTLPRSCAASLQRTPILNRRTLFGS